MAHARHGAGRCGAGLFGWLATGAWLTPGNHSVRSSFSYDIGVGSSGGAIWSAAVYLRHSGIVADRAHYRGAIEHRDGGLPDRTCAALDATADRFPNRNA